MDKRFIVAAALARALQPHIRRRHRSRLNRATSADEDGMVCTLERLYGTTSVWGDLDAAEARALYQQLLPRVLALPSKPPLNARPLTRAARNRRGDATSSARIPQQMMGDRATNVKGIDRAP